MISRRRVLTALAATGSAGIVGGIVALRPAPRRWHTDILPADPVQVAAHTPQGVFGHGVASGEPGSNRVTLWTRVTGDPASEEIPLRLEVSTAADFTHLVIRRDLIAGPRSDFCVRHTVEGLQPDTVYYYRFTAVGETSPVGRTRTLPVGGPIRLGFVSCASYGHGRFWAYRDLAARSDLHAVVHLGDYLYETPGWGHPGTYGTARQVDPPGGCVTLDDYRRRYRQYRADPELQELHRQHPVICIWDDHEFADDPYPGGAVGHDPARHGPWDDRVRSATRAWHEWMPVINTNGRIWRHHRFGTTAELVVIDRWYEALHGRSTAPVDGDQLRFLLDRATRCTGRWFLLGTGSGLSSRRSDGAGGWPDPTRDALIERLDGLPLIVMGGDAHRFDALTLPGVSQTPNLPVPGAEFAVGSVTSPGAAPGELGSHVLHDDHLHRGYTILSIAEPDRAHVDFWGYPDRAIRSDHQPTPQWLRGFIVHRDRRGLTTADQPSAPEDNPAPPAP